MHTAQSYTEKTHTAKAFHALAGRAFFRALDCELTVSHPTVTTTLPNALTGNNQPKTKPNGVNPARRLLIATDANGRAAVWFTLGKQSGEAGNMVQVSGSDANSLNATTNASTGSARTDGGDAISESVLFTATGDRGVPAKILAEGGGAQYAETGGQPLDPLTAVTYDGEVNAVPGAVIAYVIEQDGGVDLDDGAKFTNSSASNALAISNNRKVLITTADNNGRSAARPTMGTATGTVRISTYAMPPNTPVNATLVEGLANAGNGTNNTLTTTLGLVGLATFQIAVLPQSDGPTQFTGKILDHTGKPLQGVRVTISRTPLSVTTDATGNFTFLQDVPQGKLDLFVDGRAVTGTTPLPIVGGNTSASTPTQYPTLHFEVLAIRGQKNILPHPIYLPPLLMSQARIVGGSEDVSLTIPGRDGFEMIVKANSVTFPDGSRIGPLVVFPVADDRLPMSPPGGGSSFMPGAAATLQPSGTRFDPPIEVRLPNTSGYAPGERVPVYHWDHDIGQYVAMGQATVTDDGAQLITDPGSGITKAGWHGPPDPPRCVDTGTKGLCEDCQKTEIVSQGPRCPSIKICMKDYESTATCDDKDKCTVKDACRDGACKGIVPTVEFIAAPKTVCAGRTALFAAQSSTDSDRLSWYGAGYGGAGSTYSLSTTADDEGKTVVINVADRDTPSSCGSTKTTSIEIVGRSNWNGPAERDWCYANPGLDCAAFFAISQYSTDWAKEQFTGEQVQRDDGRLISACFTDQEGSELDALRHLVLSCMLHNWVPSRAAEALRAHENKNPDEACENKEQDLNNNEVGKNLANQPGLCIDKARATINAGRAQLNRPYNPARCRKLF